MVDCALCVSYALFLPPFSLSLSYVLHTHTHTSTTHNAHETHTHNCYSDIPAIFHSAYHALPQVQLHISTAALELSLAHQKDCQVTPSHLPTSHLTHTAALLLVSQSQRAQNPPSPPPAPLHGKIGVDFAAARSGG